jgi:D-inositol-3-phosphate glycosyltransferase
MTLANHSTLEPISKAVTNHRDSDSPASEIEATLLTGGFDRPYAFGLSIALASKGVRLDVIGSNELDCSEMRSAPTLNFLNLHGDQRKTVGTARKLLRHLFIYGRLIRYAATARPRIFHILWNYKFQLFDRTILMAYYKLLGKKIVFTAHNINTAQRDGNDSALNRLSLRVQYRLVDHIFVHTEKMKCELSEFGVKEEEVSVIPFGINNSIPDTELSPAQAKRRVGITNSEKTILFFGGIRPYKGLEYLVAAFQQVAAKDQGYRLIIAGEPKREAVEYWQGIQRTIRGARTGEQVIQEIRFISDEETEVYFKAADVLVLPYTLVSQSGVLFLGYSFGLPVIATNVGSLSEDIVEGETGFTCRSCDAVDLARVIETYFESDLFKTLDHRRVEIREFARGRNSWDEVLNKTCNIYTQLLAQNDEQKYRTPI